MHRKLYIPISLINENIQDRNVLDALSFAMLIKANFVDSTMRNATNRRIASFFRVGHSRVKTLIELATKYGFVQYENQELKALKLRGVGHHFAFEYNMPKHNELSAITIKDITRWIRKTFILNKMSMQSKAVVAYEKAQNPRTLKEMKSARKIVNRKSLTGSYSTLGNGRMKNLMKVSNRIVSEIKHSLISENKIEVVHNNIPTGIPTESFTEDAKKYLNENAERGYFHIHNGEVCLHTTNTYSVKKMVYVKYLYRS